MLRIGLATVCAAAVACAPAPRAARGASRLDTASRRNLALHRAAYASSTANYDDTAQLATDGVTSRQPASAGSSNHDAELVSEWTSGAGDSPSITVDLGAVSRFDEARLYWDSSRPPQYRLDVSHDGVTWNRVDFAASSTGGADDLRFSPTSARYVRLSCSGPAPEMGYSLFEFEVYGTGGVAAVPEPLPDPEPDGTQVLSGGNWRVERASRVAEPANRISRVGFDAGSWLVATVPGTVLTSYVDAGAVPDPNYGDRQLQISDAFFTANFWYRDSFLIPRNACGRRLWLDFDAINWKADVYFNGSPLGAIDGAFTRGRFDVTRYAECGAENALAVYIHENDHPGSVKRKTLENAGRNGGVLGADNPTVHASIGWDWMPTIRGRDTGILDEVSLSTSGDLSILDPFVRTTLPLPNLHPAHLALTVDLENHSENSVNGELSAVIEPGHVRFTKAVTIPGSTRETVVIDERDAPALSIEDPSLWWPNGYGPQNLYTLHLSVTVHGAASDEKATTFGVRQITSDTKNGALTLYVNGRRVFVRGGNWGMSDSMLRLGAADYDLRVRLHKEQHFTMIRNWIGMTSSEAFYDACDKYGILVWDDFWLANPSDGPDPADAKMFLNAARDKIRRVRKHPSVALYCGRNEGDPPTDIADDLSRAVTDLDGTRPYVPNSAAGGVEGHGPYDVRDPVFYFEHGSEKIHTEIGLPCVPSADSLRAMMPEGSLWPIGEMWGLHDFSGGAANAETYTDHLNASYGRAASLDDYATKAQMVNFENYRAIFEASASNHRNGALLWMSQPAWPSTVWQTYDYYLEPTGAYFGAKRGSEPVHVLWDPTSDAVKVTNNSVENLAALQVEAKIFGLDGKEKYSNSKTVDAPADTVVDCFKLSFPADLSATHFIVLGLTQGTRAVSDNFYWRGTRYEDYRALAGLPKVEITGSAVAAVAGATETLTANVSNPSDAIALMVRLKVVSAGSGQRILPVIYDDNYFSLVPGASKIVRMEFDQKYLAGDRPKLAVEGFNVNRSELPIR